MRRVTVAFDAEQVRALELLAEQQRCSVAEVVRRAVDQYAAQQLADDMAWRERLDDFLVRAREHLATGTPPAEIEADITTAREEVRQAHRATGRR